MLEDIKKAIENLTIAMLKRLNNEEKMKEWGWETIQQLAKEITNLIIIYEDIEGEENT